MTLCEEKLKVTGFCDKTHTHKKSITFKCIKKKKQAARIACTPCWMTEAAASFSILSRWLTEENDCYQPRLSSVNRAIGGLLH